MINRVINIFFIALSFLAFVACMDSDEDPKPYEVFVKYFGEDGEHHVTDMLVNSENQIIILGTQRLNIADAIQTFYLIKTDSAGNRMGDPVIIDPGIESILNANVSINSEVIRETSDGYLILGNARLLVGSNFGDNFIFWAQLNNNLELQSENSWDTISALQHEGEFSTVSMIAQDMQITSDGNVVIAGSTYYPQPNDPFEGGQSQNFLTKKSISGDSTFWRRSDGRPSFEDQIIRIHELGNGQIAAVGATNRTGSNGEGGFNVFYHVYNSQGLSQVGQTIRVGMTIGDNNAADDIPSNIIGFDTGVKVVGTSALGSVTRGFVMLFQGTGVIQNLIEPSQTSQNVALNAITETKSGDLILSGTNLNVQNGDIYIVRGDQVGAVREEYDENIMGIASGTDEAITSVTLPTGSILIASDVDFGSGQVMIGLMKMNDRVELQKQ